MSHRKRPLSDDGNGLSDTGKRAKHSGDMDSVISTRSPLTLSFVRSSWIGPAEMECLVVLHAFSLSLSLSQSILIDCGTVGTHTVLSQTRRTLTPDQGATTTSTMIQTKRKSQSPRPGRVLQFTSLSTWY